jgi:hypothetical protein
LTKSERESPTRLKVFAVSIQSSKEEKLTFSFISTYTTRFFDPAEQVGRILLQSENWQSVSVVGSSWGYVFASSIQAPQYIKKNVGSFRCQENIWDWLDDLRFKRLAANI